MYINFGIHQQKIYNHRPFITAKHRVKMARLLPARGLSAVRAVKARKQRACREVQTLS